MSAPMICFGRFVRNISRSIFKCSSYQGSYSMQSRCLHEHSEQPSGEDAIDEEQAYEDEIARLRDVSNLSKRNKEILRDQMPELLTDFQKSRKFQRKMYMTLGQKSGFDPRILFPSDLEIDTMIEDEKEWEPKFHDTMQKLQERKHAEKESMQEREKLVAANMAKMDGWIADYRKRKNKIKDKELQQAKKRAAVLDDAYEHYGYRITKKTTEYAEFMELKTESQKMEKMASRRKDREDSEKRMLEAISRKKKTDDSEAISSKKKTEDSEAINSKKKTEDSASGQQME